MTDEEDTNNDPREHIDDWEWLYQHGYLDGTLYAFSRRLEALLLAIWDAGQDTVRPLVRWLTKRIKR